MHDFLLSFAFEKPHPHVGLSIMRVVNTKMRQNVMKMVHCCGDKENTMRLQRADCMALVPPVFFFFVLLIHFLLTHTYKNTKINKN